MDQETPSEINPCKTPTPPTPQFTPLRRNIRSLMEMKETLEAQGVPEATALIMLQLFGMGVQTYTPGKK